MSIFDHVVPLISKWIPTGEQWEVEDNIVIEQSKFGMSVHFLGVDKYIPVSTVIDAKAGDKFTKAHIIELKCNVMRHDENKKLIWVPLESEEVIYRVDKLW